MQQIIIDPSSTDHQFHYLKDGNTYDCTFLNSTITCTMAIVETAKDVFIGKDTPIGPVVGFQMTEFTETVFILMGLILITLLFRIIVTSMPQKLSRFFKYIPESASVIVVGVIIGGIIRLIQRFSGVQRFNVLLSFNDQVFFLILIPPLILESGYFLNKEFFAKHLTLILLYAVVGTFLNSIVTGLALWVFGLTGAYRFTFSIVECLLFGTLISAVDPVAVLSIFDDLKVNEMLYMLVFGESVLNDVPISRFRAIHALLAFAKLVYISAGGIGVGILFGFIGSFLTRFTSGSTLYEPLVVLLFSFASYFVAESILSSGIVAILFCGAFMSRYVKLNIAKKSHTTLKYGLKLIASTSETLIFIYFGISIVLHQHKFDLGFTAATLVFILFFRFLFIFSITVVYNLIRKLYKLSTVSIAEQIILSYSGLRGIVFALAFIIPAMNAESQEKKDAIITTTMIASCFTIFIQGSTIRPLMSLLSIKKESSTCKQMSQALVDERIQLNMEEVEVANAMRHVMYLESTVNDLPKDNPERLEFEQVNRMVIEQILFRVLDEIEELNDQLIESNENYVNSEGLYGVLDTNSHIFERLAKSWREHIELIGLEKHTGTSSEALSALGRIRETVYQKSKQITAAEELHHDIECPISPKKDDREACFLLDLLEDNGVIFWSRNSEYCLSDWAKDDRVIFYIQRLLQEENIRYWIDQANEILEVKDYSRAKSLLRVLRFEIQRQQEIRNAEIDNLKRVLFAAKVFSLGIKRSMDVVSTLAGRNNTGKRYVRNVDKLVQKVCVRGLYAEESALIGALQSLKKFEFAYADTENQTEDEEVFIQQIEEQEEAIRVVQEATENENVNLQRCMSDADVNSSIAGTELVSLLELEKDTIDSKEYEERIQTKEDLISQREKDMLTAAKTRHRLSDPDVYCEQIKQAQKRYEYKLAEVLTPIPGTGPSPGTFSRDTKEPSPSIFNRKRSLGSYSATKGISPHVFSPLRSSGVHSAEYSSNVPSPSIFGRRIRRHSSHIARSPLIGEYSRKRALSESREPNFLMVHSPDTGHEFEFPAKTKKTRKQPSIADRRGLSTASELDLTLHLPDIAHPAPKPHHEDEVISLHDIPTHTTNNNNSSNKNKEELRRLHHSRSTSIPTIIITHDEDDPEEDSCKRK